MSYPNLTDASNGCKQGLISKRQYQSIARSLAGFEKPLQNTALGGDIFIHGGGTASDWTAGCIALDDCDIEDLCARLPLRTRVTIIP